MCRTLSLYALLIASLTASACGSSTTSCLAAGTLVATPVGDVRIETLRPGDVVYSVDPSRGTRHPARVMAVRTARRRCLALETATGKVVVATAEHPFYAPARRRYVAAGDWLRDDRFALLGWDEGLHQEEVIACRRLGGTRTVVDISVSPPFHNFLSNGILVHNKSYPFPTLGPIEDFLDIHDVLSAAPAVRMPLTLDYSDQGLPIALVTDPTVVGSDVIRVTASTPFDALQIEAIADDGFLDGGLRLILPAPVASADLRVTLKGGLEAVDLTLGAFVGGELGPAAFARFPTP